MEAPDAAKVTGVKLVVGDAVTVNTGIGFTVTDEVAEVKLVVQPGVVAARV